MANAQVNVLAANVQCTKQCYHGQFIAAIIYSTTIFPYQRIANMRTVSSPQNSGTLAGDNFSSNPEVGLV